ncbi:MAG: Trp biosynthesis-associated membrane protein [Actinobacteria bacterium]|nr:Trp biosynthesis-associated membrane protein [Actinomycetota bacterium]
MKRTSSGVVAILVGGALVAVGSLLTWSKVAVAMPGVGKESYTFTGMDLNSGTVTLALGALLVAVSLASLILKRSAGLEMGLALVGLAAGGFAATWGVLFFTDINGRSADAVAQATFPDASGAVELSSAAREILMNASDVVSGWGLYLAILGGIIAFIGGLLAIIDVRASRQIAAEPETPGGDDSAVDADPIEA